MALDVQMDGRGGGGGADVCLTSACLSMRTQHALCIEWTSASALVPSAGMTSGYPYACSLREQVPGVPAGVINQPQGEEKGGEARPPLSRS